MANEVDLLTGVDAIADYLGWPRRRVLKHAQDGRLPTFHLGRFLCARRSTMEAHFKKLEAGERR